jgi:hypothetical protein
MFSYYKTTTRTTKNNAEKLTESITVTKMSHFLDKINKKDTI